MLIKEVLEQMPHTGFFGDPTVRIAGFTTDSRKAHAKELFFALDGSRNKGVDFTEDVIGRKCSAICADRKYSRELMPYSGRINIILVEDVLKSLRDMAAALRSKFKGKVVAVTGSNGKTTTKELIALLLSAKYKVWKNEKNFNNEIGVPLTIFGLKPVHQVLVAECGVNHNGEMERLADMVRPELSVITNIGSAHLEFMGTEENIANEKSRLLDRTTGLVFIESDNKYNGIFTRPGLKTVTVHPEDKSADVHFDSVESLGLDGWNLGYKGVRMLFPLYGYYNLRNLVLAVAVASELGVRPQAMSKVLEKTAKLDGRASVLEGGHLTLIDESYNSNFSSLSASLENFHKLASFDRKFVVVGGMKELGSQSEELHARIGKQLSTMGLNGVFLAGAETDAVYKSYSGSGTARKFKTADEEMEAALIEALRTSPGRTGVLVKGSRANRLDAIVEKAVKKFRLKARTIGRGRKI